MTKRRGRPPKPGARYPSGKLKPVPRPDGEPMSATAVQRLLRDWKALGIDQRMASQVGRLLCLREFTAYHAAVGFRIAAVYARFEREHGKRRSVRSPSYEISYGGGLAWDDADDFGLDAERDFFSLQKLIPGQWRAAIEQLCVEDRSISSLILDEIRSVLEEIGEFLGMKRTGQEDAARYGAKTRARHGLPLHFNAHEATAGADQPDGDASEKPKSERKISIDELFWVETMQRLRPDLDREQLHEAYLFMSALRDRAIRDRKLAQTRRPERVPLSQKHPTRLGRPLLTLPPKAS